MIIAHSEPCSHCGQIVEFSPAEVVHHNGAPRKRCNTCGNYTELSFLLNLVSTFIGFLVAGCGFITAIPFLESMFGTPLHIAWFLVLFVLGIFAAVFTAITLSTICYFFHSRRQG